ncbi:hypothetical protein PVAND_017327 [Polypedilum vanderplanki]|uniref:Leucine rich repeat protein n=1 Tax=Polypedilum vanderplanki TaxID=319348 RepID=A0A9J6BID4_POLVA|nr:hypothetical protein PVAND_017327 [Polypedilum vanderplanki]
MLPLELGNFFPNLVKIYIEKGDMTEIHQAHLRNLTKLKYLSLPKNEIKKIEKNLFKFNTELEILNLEENLIKEIYPTVFDDLKKLSIITLWKNQCTNFNGSNKNEIIKEIQENCKPKFTFDINEHKSIILEDVEENLEIIKNEISEKTLKIEILRNEIKKTFKNSLISSFCLFLLFIFIIF